MPRLIYDRSQNSTIARTIDLRVPRLIYNRSQNSTIDRTIDRLWLPLVVRFPTMDHAIDLLQSIVVGRATTRTTNRTMTYHQPKIPIVICLLEIVANIADRSHVRQIAFTVGIFNGDFSLCLIRELFIICVRKGGHRHVTKLVNRRYR